MGSQGLSTGSLPGSLGPLTAFLSLYLHEYMLATVTGPALLFLVAAGYFVALCYMPVVCPAPAPRNGSSMKTGS